MAVRSECSHRHCLRQGRAVYTRCSTNRDSDVTRASGRRKSDDPYDGDEEDSVAVAVAGHAIRYGTIRAAQEVAGES